MTKQYLIVDDDPRARQMIRGMLANGNAVFTEAQDGAEAVELYQTLRPDCVIMDLEMRPLDGLTATRRIREIDAGSRVIIVSQYESRQLRDAAALAGASAFVLKENLSELERLISDLNWKTTEPK